MILSAATLTTFGIYLFLMALVGWFGYRRTRNLEDYILGGRSLGRVVTALSVGASDMSGWLLMGLPGAIYLSGLSEAWIAVGLLIGAYLNWRFVAARLRVYTEVANNALTLPDYFTARFEDRSGLLRIFSAAIILIFFTLYSASGIVAAARLFETMFGMPYAVALWVGAICTVGYVFVGGFLAVSWADAIQASLMITALVVTPVVGYLALNGGLAPQPDVFATVDTSLLTDGSVIGVVSLLAWGLGYCGQPHILARFMAARTVDGFPAARRIAMTWMFLCLAGSVAVGVIGVPYFLSHDGGAAVVNRNSELVFIELARALFNPWLTGVLLAAILAAVMSTLSCQLLVCSSALTEDIYRAFLRKAASQKELVWVGRGMVLAISVIAIGLANDPNSRILDMVGYAWAGFGAAFGPVIVLSLFWSGVTRAGALSGMVVGTLTVLIWKQGGWWGVYEIVPGVVLSAVTVAAISACGQPSVAMRNSFMRVQGILRHTDN